MKIFKILFLSPLAIFLPIGCSRGLLESDNRNLVEFSKINKGKSVWSVELDGKVGPMWEVSFGEYGYQISEFIDAKKYKDCSIQMKILNSSKQDLLVVPIQGGRNVVPSGQEYVMFSGSINSLGYHSSIVRVFPNYRGTVTRGDFTFDFIIESSCDVSLEKKASINAYRMDSM